MCVIRFRDLNIKELTILTDHEKRPGGEIPRLDLVDCY